MDPLHVSRIRSASDHAKRLPFWLEFVVGFDVSPLSPLTDLAAEFGYFENRSRGPWVGGELEVNVGDFRRAKSAVGIPPSLGGNSFPPPKARTGFVAPGPRPKFFWRGEVDHCLSACP